jgi:hypothetical protein
MARCFLLDGELVDQEISDLGPVVEVLDRRREELRALSLDDIIALLARLGKELIKDPELSSMDGATYISLWLRADNLERLCDLNYGDRHRADQFLDVWPGTEMRCQPRGTSCHWLPNNVPVMSFFSLMLAVLSKNSSILKVSEINRPVLTTVLEKLLGMRIERQGRKIEGATIVRSVCMISFDSSNAADNVMLSLAADVKLAWGSGEAVRAVAALPQKETCDTIIFGPKYSLAVFDQAFLARKGLGDVLRKLAQDAVLFDQTACSSPQVVVLERGAISAREFAEMLARAFEGLSPRLRRTQMEERLCLEVINARGTYMLSEDRDLIMPKDLGWTILMDKERGLPEPVQGRCVFLREVSDLNDVIAHMTRKVQTIALCIHDRQRAKEFANNASAAGVDRFVMPGEMHDFSLPWDGLMPLNRMVRWVTIRRRPDDDE